MQISYSLVEDDLIALAEFQVEKSGLLRKQARSRRILYPLSFGLLALGFYLLTDDPILPLIFGFLAMLSFFLAPSLYAWLARRKLPQTVGRKMTAASLGERSLTANDRGLQQRAGEVYSEVPWSLVQDIAETPNHLFVAVDGIYSVIIPKRGAVGEGIDSFIGFLRKKLENADA